MTEPGAESRLIASLWSGRTKSRGRQQIAQRIYWASRQFAGKRELTDYVWSPQRGRDMTSGGRMGDKADIDVGRQPYIESDRGRHNRRIRKLSSRIVEVGAVFRNSEACQMFL
jgi:hypothetical protein